jgi:hypothetical protein
VCVCVCVCVRVCVCVYWSVSVSEYVESCERALRSINKIQGSTQIVSVIIIGYLAVCFGIGYLMGGN